MDAEVRATHVRTTIEELSCTLPAGQPKPELKADAAVSLIERCPAGFVAPDLLLPEHYGDERVLLVEAAGAVGKSSTAAALSAMLGWPLVTAENAQVGSYSLTGLIHRAFGMTSSFIHDMAHGETGLIVDSLDEAHLKAGTQNFLAFLDDVASLAMADQQPGTRLILMSRPDTADIVELSLAEAGVPYCRGSIAMFTRDQANRFIEEYMRLRYSERGTPEYNVPLSHPIPFRSLRDNRFRELEALLAGGDGSVAADLLGYVPVLIAIAESLAVNNPSARIPKGEGSHASQVALLAAIVRGILSRDAHKFQVTVGDRLRAYQSAEDGAELVVADLFTPEEQILRLYARSAGQDLGTTMPPSLPPSLRTDYETDVSGFLADHPFTRGMDFVSVVFSDFVSATVACNPLAPVVLGSSNLTPVAPPGPFFVWFVQNNLAARIPEIPESAVESVVASWTMDAELHSDEYSPRAIIVQDGATAHLLMGDAAQTRPDLIFEIGCDSGVLVLTRAYPNLTILADGAVVLGDSANLTLPDGFHVAASEIEIDANVLSVTKGHKASLSAPKLNANRLQTVSALEDDFEVLAEKVPPKLFDYRAKLSLAYGPARGDAYISLRAILMSFRNTVHSGLCAPRDYIERYIVKGNVARQRILDALVDEGVIALEGDWFTLDSSALGRVGLSLGSLKAGTPDDAVSSFLLKASKGG